MRALPLLFLTLALSGCLTDETDAALDAARDATAFVNPVIIDEEHDHDDPRQHDIANNITEIAHLSLGPDGPPGGISEIDVAGGYAFLGVMGYGFMVVDITDPEAPELVASVDVVSPDDANPLGLYVADLKVDSTGNWIFLATELSTTPGVLIYDARDKANIQLAGFWPEPGLLLGCHMIEYAIINEQEYVFCAPLDNAVYVGLLLDPVGPTREIVQVGRWMPTTTKFAEQQVDAIVTKAQNGDTVGLALHGVSGHQDMTHQQDPLTGADVLTVSFWNLGLRFVDVSLPEIPMEVGSWQGEEARKYGGNLHTAMVFESEERRIAAAIPEGADIPALFLLDATSYDDPVLATEWTAVPDFNGQGGRYSMHNFQIVNDKIYLAMYHGGIWVLDVSTPERVADPHIAGTYMPFDRSDDNYGAGCCGGIMSWDVVVYNGYMLTANNGGFFVLALAGDPLGDPNAGSQA